MSENPEGLGTSALGHSTIPIDERQALLPDTEERPATYVQVKAQAGEDAVTATDDEVVLGTPKSKSRTWAILWTILLGLLGILLLAVFIKGFIDADDTKFDFKDALKGALGGGLSGAAAMVLQVLTLMPLRTVMNYQYRFGTTTTVAIKTLYHDGGYGRYYAGLTAALFQGPIARFGDTAANAGILALLNSNTYMKKLPSLGKTVFASLAAAAFRMILTPIDTVKTTLQAQGQPGLAILKNRIKRYGIGTLWYGAVATAAATFVGHYPWFSTYNFLSDNLPKPDGLLQKLARQAFIGFSASVVSDTVSNSLRVVKTYRQVNETKIGYLESARAVIATDGLRGLFGRGLKTRIIANGLQGLMFSILWKLFMDLWDEHTKKSLTGNAWGSKAW
ncbi:mitochondrial carrier [Punctularia strigosozonata HHB-11173 SS5]|uniref:mitochondrial carrier n=1 Tax=Punctularia strigosozonata (strain HHB-11173) TaxID=741275 RepID=UPI0004417F91|nr:mitochondrial carrier [Punctularia strigosozonata HHB-11173 SS5]EIN06821.1 mitochondrial carrier [Punctularia strigosozonata HHB-11173 SS5]